MTKWETIKQHEKDDEVCKRLFHAAYAIASNIDEEGITDASLGDYFVERAREEVNKMLKEIADTKILEAVNE